ncbi:MAG: SH3 domain-containing protein [Candidatus Thorarchaeota archaeon]
MRIARVTIDHESEFEIPLVIKGGESVEGEERETEWEGWLFCRNDAGVHGWVPKAYLNPESDSNRFQSIQDYTSRELTVRLGDEIIVMSEESGWAWARTSLGDEGWVPLNKIEDLTKQPDSVPDLMR